MGKMPSKRELAEESIHIEQNLIKETVGSQDQVSAAYGGLNHITFKTSGAIEIKPIVTSSERIDELNTHLMLFYTGIKRTATNVAQSYVENIECKKRQLRIMKDLVHESLDILNGDCDIRFFGELMHEAWMAKRSLSCNVSNSEIDELYDKARHAGAIGGKLTGAGGGGFLLLCVPPSERDRVIREFDHLIHVPFKFEFSGTQIIFFDRQLDYSSLEKVRSRQCISAFRELETVAKSR